MRQTTTRNQRRKRKKKKGKTFDKLCQNCTILCLRCTKCIRSRLVVVYNLKTISENAINLIMWLMFGDVGAPFCFFTFVHLRFKWLISVMNIDWSIYREVAQESWRNDPNSAIYFIQLDKIDANNKEPTRTPRQSRRQAKKKHTTAIHCFFMFWLP